MATPFKNDFSGGINLDLDETKLPPNMAMFIKNVVRYINTNASAAGLAGSNQETNTPIEGNAALSLTLPTGTNYTVGFYNSEQTNEGYFLVWNSDPEKHSIWVIRGVNGAVQKVYEGLLNFQLNPEFYIKEGRCTIQLIPFFNKVTNEQDYYKMFCYVDNFNEPRCISVEDSIATSSFSTPYFTDSAANYIADTLTTLGMPLPIKTLKINDPTPYVPQPEDEKLQNLLLRRVFQFRNRFRYIFGFESDWGIISEQYTPIYGGGCVSGSNDLPRCVNLIFDAGNPYVDSIDIAYRPWIDGTTPFEGDWQLADTIYRWNNSSNVAWYNRTVNPDIVYDVATNEVTYTFCFNKESIPIDRAETDRTGPDVPRWCSGLASIMERLMLSNTVHGFQPISPAELAKVKVEAQEPADDTLPCQSATLRRVVILINIHNPYGNYTAIVRQSYSKVVFGNSDYPGRTGNGCDPFGYDPVPEHTSSFTLEQVFADQDNPGFPVYLAGTEYTTVTQQVDFNPTTGTWTKVGYGPGIVFTGVPMQLAEFYVKPGEYLARVGSHRAKVNDGNLQQTSTYVAGQNFIGDLIIGGDARYNWASFPSKELDIFCTDDDVILTGTGDKMLTILDLGDGVDSGALDGYLCEERGGGPVECNPIWLSSWGPGGGQIYGSFFTDHNGFFFMTSAAAPLVKIFTDFCDGGVVEAKELKGNRSFITHGDGTGHGPCNGNNGYWNNKVYLKTANNKYPDCARRKIKQKIGLCDDITIGVPNIRTMMNYSAVGTTDANGEVVLIAHNRYNYLDSIGGNTPPPLSDRVPEFPGAFWNDSLFFSPSPGCPWFNCDLCVSNLGVYPFDYKPCCDCDADPECRTTQMTQQNVRIATRNQIGIQPGGTYWVGIVLHDEITRHTFVQKIGQVTAKTLNEAKVFALEKIAYLIDPSFQVPTYFKYLTFVVGINTTYRDLISWPCDWVQPVDNTGATNTTNPTSIRIYWPSLIEYNKQYGFNTTTNWQPIVATETGTPVVGDIIQFIMNGDGTFFDGNISATISYASQGGKYFTIPYDSRLSNLMNGALFQIIRPRQLTEQDGNFYEQCLTLELIDGQVQTADLTGTLPYEDCYILSRQIPVPLLKGQVNPIPPGGAPTADIQYTSTGSSTEGEGVGSYDTNNAANNNNVVVFSTTNYQTSYPFYFPSPSISDLFGNHVADRGRRFFVNPQEQERRLGTEIMLSGAILEKGTYVGLNYFDEENSYVFDKNAWGNIVIATVETSIILVICESDNFLTRFNYSQLIVNNKTVESQATFGPFTAPERKAGSNYGCRMSDYNSIAKLNGIVSWLDATGYLIFHNFSEGKPVQFLGYDGYLKNKIALNNIRNNNPGNGTTYWVGEFDGKTWKYILTSFNIPESGSPSYLNNLTQPSLVANETFMVDMATGILQCFPSFTYEMYGRMQGYYLQSNFISFKNGVPYIHHNNYANNVTPPLYANFHGVQCPCYIVPVVNIGSETVKRFFYMEIYTGQNISNGAGVLPSALFYAPVINTEKNQVSRLLVPQWDIRNNFQCAGYLCDLNTPADPNLPVQTGVHVIRDGNNLIGRWMKLLIKTNDSWAGTYWEMSAIINYVNIVEKSGK